MSGVERMMIELNKRVQEAEAQNQQMERRIKELESQTNSLGVIEPSNEGLLVLGVVKIEEWSVLNEANASSPGFGSGVKLSIEPDPGAKRDKWPIFKFPNKIRHPDLIFIPEAKWTMRAGEGESPGINLQIRLIEEDFDIDEVTWNDAQSFTTIRYGGLAASLTGPDAFFEAEPEFKFPFSVPLGMAFGSNISVVNDTLFTGFFLRDVSEENFRAEKSILESDDFRLDIDDSSQRAFYIPNGIFRLTIR